MRPGEETAQVVRILSTNCQWDVIPGESGTYAFQLKAILLIKGSLRQIQEGLSDTFGDPNAH